MELKETITRLVEEQLAGTDYFIVNVSIAGPKKISKITVILDGDQGISVDACARISRRLGEQLEEQNLVPAAYTLEVSSPGLDQPLQLPRQYHRNVGRDVRVHLLDGSTKTGKLEAASDNDITITEAVKGKHKPAVPLPAVIPLHTIDKTYILVSFK